MKRNLSAMIKKKRSLFATGLFIWIHWIGIAQQEKSNLSASNKKQIRTHQTLKKADSLANNKNPETASKLYKRVFDTLEYPKDADLFLPIGIKSYESLTDLDKFKYRKQRLEILDKLYANFSKKDHQKAMGIILTKYADYFQFKDKIKSLQYTMRAEKLLLAQKDSVRLVGLYNLKAILFRSNQEYERAADQLKKAVLFLSDHNTPKEVTRTYARLLREFIFQEISAREEWLPFYEQGAKICNNEMGDKEICAVVYINGAYLYAKSGNPEKAVEIITKRIDFNVMRGSTSYYGIKFPYFAEYVAGYTYQKTGNDQKALQHLLVAKKFCEKHINNSLHSLVSESLTDIYLKQGNVTKAKEEIDLKRKLDVMQIRKNRLGVLKLEDIIADLQKEKKLKIQESEIKTLATTNKTIEKSYIQIQSFLYSVVILFLILLSSFIYYLNYHKIKLLQLREEASVNKVKLLQSAMNPHFLFNTFGTLQHFILSKENLKANEYLTQLSGLIRSIFQTTDKTFLPFSEELNILKSYINLEQERFKKPFKVHYSIAPDLITEDPLIPVMIIQPYVENAIKHGFEDKNQTYNLSLTFTISTDHIRCEVTDDGIGRNASQGIQQKRLLHSQHLSIATKNTRERLAILKKVEGLKGSIHITDLYNADGIGIGTKVLITLPTKKNI